MTSNNDISEKMYNDLEKSGEYKSEKRKNEEKTEKSKREAEELSEKKKYFLFGDINSPGTLSKILGSTR